RLCDLTSYTRDRLLNMKFSELLHTDERRMLNGDGTAKEGFSDIPNVFTVRLVRGDGELRHIEFSVRSFTYSGEDAILGIARDITILKKLENEQKKKEKLESLGLLAGGIAHNFNNFLTAIMGNISLARTMVEPGSDLYEILTNSEHAASKASNLPRQLLTFSMGGDPVRSRVSMGRIIRDSADFALSGSSTTAEYSIPDDLKQVFIDGEQIAQVINNIVTNAQQSMPDGGRVCIDAENILIHENDPLTIPEGQYIKIAISDNGIGIEDNHLNRVFDPFFTTKRNGTGLGLATAYSIIRKHSGYIKIKTKAGAGSTFTIYLPAELHSESSDAREPGPEKLSGGKILVMDDKELVRETVMIMLSRLGYEVDSASDGREAIVKYKSAMSTSEPFNAVILDLTVPNGLGGMETMEELQKIDPDITAVVSSGYSNAPVMSDYSVYGFAGVIMKPYSITQLSDLLRKVFNE
ncbi:MAG: ATP-binding protein, partial [Candidatus Fermentibacteria bacterium]